MRHYAWITYTYGKIIIIIEKDHSTVTPEYFASQGFVVGFKRFALVRGWPHGALIVSVYAPQYSINIINESGEAEIRSLSEPLFYPRDLPRWRLERMPDTRCKRIIVATTDFLYEDSEQPLGDIKEPDAMKRLLCRSLST